MSSSAVDGGWVRVAAAFDIAENSTLSVRVGDQPVCLVRSRGQLHALVDECTHGQVPLSDGDVEDGTIECWLHGSRFDLATGRPLTPPATQPVRTFPVCVAGDDVYVSRVSWSER